MQDGRACSVKMLALTKKKGKKEWRGDWKINGVCDWQPMILGIRLNWIRERESAGHDPQSAWDRLILNIQEYFPPSPSAGYKAWSQNTTSSLETHSLKSFKSKLAQPFGSSQYVCANTKEPVFAKNKLATCWQDLKRQICVLGNCEGCLIYLKIADMPLRVQTGGSKTKQASKWTGNLSTLQHTVSLNGKCDQLKIDNVLISNKRCVHNGLKFCSNPS